LEDSDLHVSNIGTEILGTKILFTQYTQGHWFQITKKDYRYSAAYLQIYVQTVYVVETMSFRASAVHS